MALGLEKAVSTYRCRQCLGLVGVGLVGGSVVCLELVGGDNGLRVEAVVSALTRRTCADNNV